MQAHSKILSGSARSLMCLAILSHASLVVGGVTPLHRDTNSLAQPQLAPSEPTNLEVSSTLFDQMNAGAVTVPVIDLTPAPSQAVAPASVPLPPAIETGLSGGAALMIAAGLRKLRRVIRRGF